MLEIGQEWRLYTTPFRLGETTTPSNAEVPSGTVAFYAKDNGSGVSTLCYKNDAGTEICFPTTGAIVVTGAGVAGRLAFWDSTSNLTSDADLTFLTDTLSATKVASSTLTTGRLTFASTAGLLVDDATLTYAPDSSNSSIITLGDNTHTGVINTPAGLTLNIDSDNNDTGALLAIQSNTALRLTGGTRLFTINESGAFGVGNGVSFGSSGQVLTSGGNAASPSWTSVASTSLIPGGRLTLTSATPVLSSDVTASTSIYYAFYNHDRVPIYNGTTWSMETYTELTNTTTDNTKNPAAVTTNSNYDLFVWSDSGTLRLGRGPAWTSDTARGTGAGTTELERVNGIWMNKIAITNGPAAQRGTYVGTVRSNGSSQIDWKLGTAAAGGGESTLYVWNMYNRVTVAAAVRDSNNTWTYGTAAWQSADASNTYRVSMVRGLDEEAIAANYGTLIASGDATVRQAAVGVCLDATNTFTGSTMIAGKEVSEVTAAALFGFWFGLPGLGKHFIQAVEYAQLNTVTFYGDGGAAFIQGELFVQERM